MDIYMYMYIYMCVYIYIIKKQCFLSVADMTRLFCGRTSLSPLLFSLPPEAPAPAEADIPRAHAVKCPHDVLPRKGNR